MRFILCAFIFNSYGEEWWKSLIPFCSEYTLATVACNPLYFWIYLACSVVGVIFLMMGMFPLALLALAASLIVYSIILFAVFVSTDEMGAKIPAMIIFVTDVLLPILSFGAFFMRILL